MDDPFPNIDLSVLTPRQREVVEMHYDCLLTFGQIAMFLGVSRQAAEQCHQRALRRLLYALTVDTSHYKTDA
jgi:DNA-directed RNA polymerase specialized sigma subunit